MFPILSKRDAYLDDNVCMEGRAVVGGVEGIYFDVCGNFWCKRNLEMVSLGWLLVLAQSHTHTHTMRWRYSDRGIRREREKNHFILSIEQ